MMLGDILLRMPLYMYCQVVRFNYKVSFLFSGLLHRKLSYEVDSNFCYLSEMKML